MRFRGITSKPAVDEVSGVTMLIGPMTDLSPAYLDPPEKAMQCAESLFDVTHNPCRGFLLLLGRVTAWRTFPAAPASAGSCERDFVLFGVYEHVISIENFAAQDFLGERILHRSLDRAFEGPRTVLRIIATSQEYFLGGAGELKGDFTVGQRAAHFLQSKVNDFEQLLFAERIADNDFVNAVEELRLEVNSQGIHYLLARLLRIPGGAR